MKNKKTTEYIKKKIAEKKKADAETDARVERIKKSKNPTEQFFAELSNILK